MTIFSGKNPRALQVLATIGNLLIVFVIVASGIDAFWLYWSQTTLIYSLGVIIGAIVWYLIWNWQINSKEEFNVLQSPDNDKAIDPKADKGLIFESCSECEQESYYFSTMNDEPRIVTCWNCGNNISYVWCEKCGMGGDFIAEVSEKPTSWECPGCHGVYPIPVEIFENPIASMSDENIPVNANLSRLKRQKNFEKEQAIASVLVLTALLLCFTLFYPIGFSFTRLFEKYLMMTVGNQIGNFFAFILTFPVWYGLWFYPLLLRDKIKRFQAESV